MINAREGHDMIDASGGGTNTLLLGGGLTEDRLNYVREGDDLLIRVDKGITQSIRILNHFKGGEYAIDAVQPDSGYLITATQINQRVAAAAEGGHFDTLIEGSDQSDQLQGDNSANLIRGNAGDDTLFSFAGNDQLEGGDGNDSLYGGNGSGTTADGDDTLIGGAGNDILYGERGNDNLKGGTGDDRYYYAPQGGIDTIDNTGGGRDGLFFLNGIGKDQLSFKREGDDLGACPRIHT